MPSIRPALLRLVVALTALTLPACAANTIHIPADQPTIQAGINAASNGDTVLVAPGTYFENINFNGKAITVTSSGGANVTTIDGGNTGGVATVLFSGGETSSSVISGFTIRGGGDEIFTGTSDGGIEVKGFLGNVAGPSPTIQNNIITANYCHNIDVEFASPTILNNEISGVLQGTGTGSQESYCGTNNAIYLAGTSNFQIEGSVVIGNTIENNSGGGSAINAFATQNVLISKNIIHNNTSYSPGSAFLSANSTGTVLVQNLIYGNTSTCGGALGFENGGYTASDPSILIANNTIVDNDTPTLNTGSECTSIGQIYPGPYSYGSSAPGAAVINNIISGSTSYPAANCSWFQTPSEADQPTFDHNILYNAGGVFFGSYCIDVSAKYGNIVADPQFVNSATNDYHLKPTSPAIDAGNNSFLQIFQKLIGTPLTQDFDGNPRLQDVTGKNYPVVDIGAYEYPGVVEASATTIVLRSSAYIGNAGSNYTLTATLVSALGTPTGAVTFFLDGQQIGSSTINGAGIATLTNFLLPPGIHNLYATYSGQGSFTPAISVIIILDISKYVPTLNLTSSVNPSLVGQSVTFTITASSPDGIVPSPITLTDTSTNTLLATLTPNSGGIATYTTSTLATGSHFISASYAGDASHTSISANVFQQVINGFATNTSLTSSLNPALVTQNVTFTATVTSTTGTPTGTVTFKDGATTLATQTLATGTASFSTSALAIGTHPITATYNPTSSYTGSSSSLSQVINGVATTTALTSSLYPSNAGQSVTFTATVTSSSGTPTGSITFSDGATTLATQTLAAGTASFTTSALAIGTRTITATYTATGTYAGSSKTLSQVVNGISTNTTLFANSSAYAGANVAFGITLALNGAGPVPNGSISLREGATTLATTPLVVSGSSYTANFSLSTLAVGAHTITAVYSGDSAYNSSTSNPVTVTILINPTTLTLTSSLNPSRAFQTAVLTAQIASSTTTALPTGSIVTFLSNGSPIGSGTINASGMATLTTLFPAGTYALTAAFPATASFSAATSAALSQSVAADSTTTTITAAPNPGVQNQLERLNVFVVPVSSTLNSITAPTGTVTLYDGTTALGPASPLIALGEDLAAFTFAPGTHTITSSYSGDANFLPSTSAPITLVIAPQDFTLTPAPTISIQTEHHAPLSITLTSIGSFTDSVAFSCGNLPEVATCTFTSNPMPVATNATVTTSVMLDTDAVADFKSDLRRPASPFTQRTGLALATLLPLGLFARRRRRSQTRKFLTPLLIILLSVAALSLTACSGKYPAHTPPGTYTITITAQALATHLTHSASVTFTVTP